MSEYQCDNCSTSITSSEKICPTCGYPQQGTRAEKIAYNTRLIRFKDLVEDSEKSVKGILSFAIIFIFMAFVVALFSLLFNENHYANALIFLAAAFMYLLLYRLGKKSSYLMAVLAFLFYTGHTIFEISSGIYLKSPVDLDKSFVASKGASLFFELIPIAYLLFRLALMIVLAKFLWIELKLKRGGKIVKSILKQSN